MYRVKTYHDPKYNLNINESITYDFYNSQDAYLFGFNGFYSCKPNMVDHKMNLLVEWHSNYFFTEDHLNFNSQIYKYLKIKLKNNSVLNESKIYWITNEDDTWNEEKSQTFQLHPKDSFYFEYVIDLENHPYWKGEIRQVKFCPLLFDYNTQQHDLDVFGVELNYDYIQFSSENLHPSSLVFPFKYDTDSFTFENGAKALNHRGTLYVDLLSSESFMQSPTNLAVNTQNARFFRIVMKNMSNAGKALFYYTTNEDRVFTENKRIEFSINPLDNEFTEYMIRLDEITSELFQFRIKVCGNESRVEIDYIMIDTIDVENMLFNMDRQMDVLDENCFIELNKFEVNATLLKYLIIELKNQTYSNCAKIQWVTDVDSCYDEKKCQKFIIDEMGQDIKKYTVELNQNQYWRGNIVGLRITPALNTNSGKAYIKTVMLCGFADTLCQNSVVREGYVEDTTGNWTSGWTHNRGGGEVRGHYDYEHKMVFGGNLDGNNSKNGTFRLVSLAEKNATTSISKELSRHTEGFLQWYLTFQMDYPNCDNIKWSLLDDDKDALGFVTKNGYFATLNDEKIYELTPLKWHIMRVDIDLTCKKYTVVIDGNRIDKVFSFENSNINKVYISTPAGKDVMLCGKNRIYKAGYLFEDFAEYSDGDIPANFDISSDKGVKIERNILNFQNFDDGEPLVIRKGLKKFAKGSTEIEIDFLIDGNNPNFILQLLSEDVAEAAIEMKDGNFSSLDGKGERHTLWSNYKRNIWYKAMLIVNPMLGTVSFMVNGQVKSTGHLANKNTQLTDICIQMANGDNKLCFRKIRVSPHFESTVPYIDKVESLTGLVGMQAWFIREGMWIQVDGHYDITDKVPYFGYYDDRNVEVMDWQIKLMAEHGIDFVAPFFYVDHHNGLLNPVFPTNAFSIETFFMHSQQNDKMKACIYWGEIFEEVTRNKIINNVMPYFIETFFKHPSYLKIDNKPVLLSYSWQTILQNLNTDGTKELLNEMRQMCINEGFDGLIILGESRTFLDGIVNSMEKEIDVGLDSIYAYCNLYTPKAVMNYINTSREKGLEAIPTIGCGWDNRWWATPQGYFIKNNTPSEFEQCIQAVKDHQLDLLNDKADLSKRMVLFDNWSEFGEGHSILPSNLYGFGYLNAIRKVLTNAEELHYDTVPEGLYNALDINSTDTNEPQEKRRMQCRIPMPE